MKKFIVNIIIFAVLIGLIVGSINIAYKMHIINYGTMGDKKNDNSYVTEVPDGIEICNFGNSHGYYAYDYEKYNDKKVCFNFALPSQSLSYDYLILDNYKDKIKPGAVVLINISYMSFYGKDEIYNPDFSAMNKRYYHFLDKNHIKEYDLATDVYVNWLPALTAPNIIDLLKTVIGVNQTEDDWSEVIDKETAAEHGKQRYESHVAKNVDESGNRIINENEIDAVYKMIDLCREIGATPVLVTTPYLEEYVSAVEQEDPAFYDDFYGQINQIILDKEVEYYDYQRDSAFYNQYELFMNTDHLNKSGAKVFTDMVMEDIARIY